MDATNINIPSTRLIQGIFWMLMMCSLSNVNDIIMKVLGDKLPVEEIAFFGFFCSTILLLFAAAFYVVITQAILYHPLSSYTVCKRCSALYGNNFLVLWSACLTSNNHYDNWLYNAIFCAPIC